MKINFPINSKMYIFGPFLADLLHLWGEKRRMIAEL